MTKLSLHSFTPSSEPFHPTRVLYIHTHPSSSSINPFSSDNKTKTDVFDITSSTISDPNLNLLDPAPDLVPKLEHLAREADSPLLTITRKNWYKRLFEATDVSTGKAVARIDGPLLALGHWKLSFLEEEDGDAVNHDIELRPTGPGSTADVFVKESVPYFWEVVRGRAAFKLWKGVVAEGDGDGNNGVRREVGTYVARHHRTAGKEGVLVLDDETVDIVVGVMTCIGTVNRSESFRK